MRRAAATTIRALLGCAILGGGALAADTVPPPDAPATGPDPGVVQPVAGTLADAPTETAQPPYERGLHLAERLDWQHDWLYRRMQRLLSGFDTAFSRPDEAALIVPVSPLRVGLDAEFLRGASGMKNALRPDFEATIHLPNIERRFTIFVSSADLQESSADPNAQRNPVRAGIRFAARAHASFDVGVRLKLRPVAFASLRWAPHYRAGSVDFFPFIKPYIESGLGLGTSGGVAIEHWRERWIVRSASFADWERRLSATSWTQTLQLGHAQAMIREGPYDRLAAGHDLACGTLAHLSASGDRLGRAMTYEAGVTIKRPLRGGWLYGYVEPVIRWERVSQWHPDAGARVGFDVLFWGLASLPGEIAERCE